MHSYDVLICGGGLAGLTLAYQLRREVPEASVAVIDRLNGPLPEAAHKVGESLVELASLYIAEVLDLRGYLRRRHLPKLGIRGYFGDPHGPLEARPEVGPKLLPPVSTYQIDRGRLENDLRELVTAAGAVLLEGTVVEDIQLADGTGSHVVRCRRRSDSRRYTLCGRWVVDALGRRRLLRSKLELGLPNAHAASAAWWRVRGRVDVGDTGAARDRRWRRRIPEDRWLSTSQLMGRGYWVWLIPLGSGSTSVGIVTDETIHPFETYGRSHEHALSWLHAHEPALWRLLRDRTPLDFHGLRRYSYDTRQLFSHARWACSGEAGLFLDPLYSFGSDFIAMENTIIVELVRRERRGELLRDDVDDLNRLVLDELAPYCLDYYTGTYCAFGHAQIFTAKLAWDTAVYWALLVQLFAQSVLLRPTPEVFAVASRYRALNTAVQRLFADWAKSAPPRPVHLPHADLTRMRFLQLLHLDLTTRRDPDQVLKILRMNLDRFEELAQVLFWQAVAEALPEHAPAGTPPWVDAWRISLDPGRWAADGLFTPETARRPLRGMGDTFAGVFAPLTWRQWLLFEAPYRLLHLDRDRFTYPLVRSLHRRLVTGRSAMHLRRLFVVDRPAVPRAAAPARHGKIRRVA